MNASLEKAIQEAMADLDWLSSRWKTGTNKETDKIDKKSDETTYIPGER